MESRIGNARSIRRRAVQLQNKITFRESRRSKSDLAELPELRRELDVVQGWIRHDRL